MEEEKIRYVFKDKSLGKGISGEVLLAYDLEKDIDVAAKHIPKNLVNDQKEMELFTNEVLISTLCENENLAKVHDISDIDGEKYLIFEYCNGGDLQTALSNYKKKHIFLDEKIIQNIVSQILNGLQCLHNKKIIHHDIKPANILLHYDNIEDLNQLNLMKCKFKISDFGLSKFKNEQYERMIGGSPLYMEPYLFDKNVPISIIENEKVDIWSLGILTYELLFGITPFENSCFIPDNALRELVSNLSRGTYFINMSYRDKISLQIIAFLNKCLQIEQNKRASSEELLFSEFVTRDIEKFFFLNKYNLKKNFPQEYIIYDDKIKMDIKDGGRLNVIINI